MLYPQSLQLIINLLLSTLGQFGWTQWQTYLKPRAHHFIIFLSSTRNQPTQEPILYLALHIQLMGTLHCHFQKALCVKEHQEGDITAWGGIRGVRNARTWLPHLFPAGCCPNRRLQGNCSSEHLWLLLGYKATWAALHLVFLSPGQGKMLIGVKSCLTRMSPRLEMQSQLLGINFQTREMIKFSTGNACILTASPTALPLICH